METEKCFVIQEENCSSIDRAVNFETGIPFKLKEEIVEQSFDEEVEDVDGPSQLINSPSLVKDNKTNGLENTIKLKKKFQCTLCDYNSNYKNHIKSHTDAVHLKLKRHKCHLCTFAAAQRYNLRVHINSVHLNLKHNRTRTIKEHKCSDCDFVTKYQATLREHTEKIHLKINHKCDMCDFVTDIRRCLKMHQDVTHLNLKPHRCNLCDFSSNWQKGLKNHIQSEHSRHECNICDFVSSEKYELKNHIADAHSDSKHDEDYFECELCGESISNLSTHMNSVHLKPNKFKCNLCNYGTNYRNSLIQHFESVHLKMIYECEDCDFSAKYKRNLKKHVDEVHSGRKAISQ